MTCINCGKCCYIFDKILKKRVKCKHLVILEDGKTKCRIYNNRLYKCIFIQKDGSRVLCSMRDRVKLNYPGCPYNIENQPIANGY